MTARRVVTFYRFVPIRDTRRLAADLESHCAAQGLLGTVVVATEGINGTVEGTAEGLDALRRWLDADSRFAGMALLQSPSRVGEPAFHRLRIRERQEIVAFGQSRAAPLERRGEPVDPRAFDALLADPGVPVIDVRNRFEIAIGAFEGAVDPGTSRFREFADAAAAAARGARTVAMYCTGGVRCEKASALLLNAGFDTVYQLDGGILRYLRDTPREGSRWRGECFVFDRRVALDHALRPGTHTLCYGCRRPLSQEDRRSPLYEAGVRCAACADRQSEAQRSAFRERRRQEALARERGRRHVGARQDPGRVVSSPSMPPTR